MNKELSTWLGLRPISMSPSLMLNTASLCALGYELDLGRPVIRFWNDTSHLRIDTTLPTQTALHVDRGSVHQIEWSETFKTAWVFPHFLDDYRRTA
jgi:hypothetical protein